MAVVAGRGGLRDCCSGNDSVFGYPPVAVAVAGGLGGEQRQVGGALLAWPATAFVRLCASGIVVVPLAVVVRWLLSSTMVVRLVAPAGFAARR
jgi:hypothetical protein